MSHVPEYEAQYQARIVQLPLEEFADRIAATLKYHATCTVLVGTHSPQELFEAIKSHIPCAAVLSTTGRTLWVGVITENPKQFGNNDAINLRTHMNHCAKVRNGTAKGRLLV